MVWEEAEQEGVRGGRGGRGGRHPHDSAHLSLVFHMVSSLLDDDGASAAGRYAKHLHYLLFLLRPRLPFVRYTNFSHRDVAP